MSHQVTEDPPATAAGGDRIAVNSSASELHPDPPGVRRLYSAAMMADLLGVPPAAIRHWIRAGLLAVVDGSGSLEWLDFGQLVVARRLARLLDTGLSLREIDAQLAGLAPGGGSVAARAVDRVVADGRRLSIDREGLLLGAGGQLQFAFYTDQLGVDRLAEERAEPLIVEISERLAEPAGDDRSRSERFPGGDVVDEILDLADDLEAAGEYMEAAEALRAVLQAQGPTAAVTFMLAELLYRAGDLTAARERYYATIELDPDHLRARASLGCVLGELGELELALAALEGVLRQAPNDADAHWHTAGILAELGRAAEARRHLQRFLTLAPQSPWAPLALERLAGLQDE